MHEKKRTSHCAEEELVDFLEGQLSAAGEQEVNDHLAVCPACTSLLGEVAETAVLVDGWTATNAAELHLRIALPGILRECARASELQAVSKRLEAWARRPLAKGLLELTRKTAAGVLGVPSGMEGLRVENAWQFVPAVMSGAEIRVMSIRGLPDARVEVAEFTEKPGLSRLRIRVPAGEGAKEGDLVVLADPDGAAGAQARELRLAGLGMLGTEFIFPAGANLVLIFEPEELG